MVAISYYLILSAALVAIGTVGVLIRRNPLVMFMAIELMLNAANLALVAIAHELRTLDGQVIAFLVIVVAAAEVTVGLAIIVSIFRSRETVDVDEISALKG